MYAFRRLASPLARTRIDGWCSFTTRGVLRFPLRMCCPLPTCVSHASCAAGTSTRNHQVAQNHLTTVASLALISLPIHQPFHPLPSPSLCLAFPLPVLTLPEHLLWQCWFF